MLLTLEVRPQLAAYELVRSDARDTGAWGPVNVVERPDTAKWRQMLRWTGVHGEQKRLLSGFANAIRYRGNTVRLPVFGYERGGPGGGTPLVKGVQGISRALVTDGWSATNAVVLDAGDFVEVDGYLYQLSEPAETDGAGESILLVEPERRTVPADNAPVEYLIPTGLFHYDGGSLVVQSRVDDGLTRIDVQIELIEV